MHIKINLLFYLLVFPTWGSTISRITCRLIYLSSATVIVEISKDRKQLNLSHLEKDYHEWILQMHDAYDEEAQCGEDEPILVIAPSSIRNLGLSADGKSIRSLSSYCRFMLVLADNVISDCYTWPNEFLSVYSSGKSSQSHTKKRAVVEIRPKD